MRQGKQPSIIFDKQGEIVAINTGSDFVGEHEWGYNRLQQDLCRPLTAETLKGTGLWAKVPGPEGVQEVCMIQRFLKSEPEVVEALRAGERVGYRPLYERTGLSRNLTELLFIKSEEEGQPVAIFGYSVYGATGIRAAQLVLDGQDYAAAWCADSFAFKVRGAELVAKLERFYAAAMQGESFFAGSFLQTSRVRYGVGLVIARRTKLSAKQHDAMYWAQKAWEEDMRRKAGAPPAAPVKLPKYALC